MKKGFTLIELLAVIVILAIISLIAVPIFLKVIEESKLNSEVDSMKLYIRNVELEIAAKRMVSEFEPKECEIKHDGNILCDNNELLKINSKGIKPKSGLLYIKDGSIFNYKNIEMNIQYYNKDNDGKMVGTKEKQTLCKLLNDLDDNGLSKGDKYLCEVKPNEFHNFYVLSDDTKKEVNLIMDRNICNDGKTEYTSANDYCRYKWHDNENNNGFGPDTAMQILYDATKEWSNVFDMKMNYFDINNDVVDEVGYSGIVTNNDNITNIIKKDGSISLSLGNATKPLKARLPMESEVKAVNCDSTNESCPTWLMDNLKYNTPYTQNNNNESYQNINGYWLLDSYPNDILYARCVRYSGYINSVNTSYTTYGIRPVITILKYEL